MRMPKQRVQIELAASMAQMSTLAFAIRFPIYIYRCPTRFIEVTKIDWTTRWKRDKPHRSIIECHEMCTFCFDKSIESFFYFIIDIWSSFFNVHHQHHHHETEIFDSINYIFTVSIDLGNKNQHKRY